MSAGSSASSVGYIPFAGCYVHPLRAEFGQKCELQSARAIAAIGDSTSDCSNYPAGESRDSLASNTQIEAHSLQ